MAEGSRVALRSRWSSEQPTHDHPPLQVLALLRFDPWVLASRAGNPLNEVDGAMGCPSPILPQLDMLRSPSQI